MQTKKHILSAIFWVVATGSVLGVVMMRPLVTTYIPIVLLCTGAFALLFRRKRLSRNVGAWFSRLPNSVMVIWLLDIIGGTTLICATIAYMLEPIVWSRILPDKVPALSGFLLHILLSGFVSTVCIVLYGWQVHAEKNTPSDRRGNRVLSLVIQYLRNETTDCRGKSNGYLIKLLVFEIKVGRLHLWGRKNNKDIFIRPKDLKSKRYVFELYHNEYRLRSPVDETVIWGPAFIEREVKERWPQIKPSAG